MPNQWVVRERSRDYGIDLEVEVFHQSGASTGAIFYVQLRATDDQSKARKIALDLDQVEYFHSLEIPTLIARYCDADKSLYIKWHFEIPPPRDGASTLTLKFDESDQWGVNKPEEIIGTLKSVSRLRSTAPLSTIGFKTNNSADGDRYDAFQNGISALVSLECGLLRTTDADSLLTVEIACRADEIAISIGKIASVTVADDSQTEESVLSHIAYGVVYLLYQTGLWSQSARIARALLEGGIVAPHRALASRACVAVAVDPASAADLALLNNIHTLQDEHLVTVLSAIHRAATKEVRSRAVVRILEAALKSVPGADGVSLSALRYSLGNHYRGEQTLFKSVSCYNKARHLSSVYDKTDYFWSELAGVLFLAGRFALSAKIYRYAGTLATSPRVIFLLGDALMMSGAVLEAVGHFSTLPPDTERRLHLEGQLRSQLCEWLARRYGPAIERRRNDLGTKVRAFDGVPLADWPWAELSQLDPLDPLANFNMAVRVARSGDKQEAFWRFLLVALIQANDDETWHNTLACAWPNAELFAAVLELSLQKCGQKPYLRLRKAWIESGLQSDVIGSIDQTVMSIQLELDRERTSALTVRLFDGNQFRNLT
ncbi:MAG: DUF4365 domain-containing protein [Alphaproteobacteria bacterium]|jgi:hypothetical protein|nr:DUF4365 domain-containing protein [Alphaproteobacteria bacterium]MBU2125734.1 DUF4365 domain-containing protein [Alphaproteobacteria bacterium]MBU2207758.1 DUF4365 domain-containing protein [Alphaproteobacteria bacterium]MBU2397904.1 DUF4365 domain-containing protein [Alphaproteobacteria bacterium]